jgi:hypothetical protein
MGNVGCIEHDKDCYERHHLLLHGSSCISLMFIQHAFQELVRYSQVNFL